MLSMPGRKLWLCAAVFLGAALLSLPARAIQTIDVSQIRRGMVGYGLTVFHGTRPEKFRVRVVGILHNAFPKQDLILIMCDDPKLKKPGVVAGMSGSPIYFNGKLAGALAYGPVFAKDPVAMVTPIKNMLGMLKRPLRGPNNTVLARRFRFKRKDAAMLAKVGFNHPGLRARAMLPASWAAPSTGTIRRLSLPVTVSGFDPVSLGELKKLLKPYGMVPVAGGGGGTAAVKRYGKQRRFVAGSPIGVQFIRGDVTLTSTGTVTAVVGNKVLAFGHPFWGIGEHYVPVVGAWIHMFMASRYSSYKISTPLNTMGSLEQDRRPAIIADSSKKAPMIPFILRVRASGDKERVFKTEIFSNRVMSYMYMYLLTRVLLRTAASDLGDTSIKAKVRLGVKGAPSMAYTDYFSTLYGAGWGFSPMMTRGFRLINFLMRNPFRRVNIKKVEVDLDIRHKLRKAEIWGLRVSSTDVEPGSIVNLAITLKRHRGPFFKKVVAVRIPNLPDGTLIRILAQPGPYAYPDKAPPRNLTQMLKILRRTYSATQMVVTVRTAGEGTSVKGRLITDLPGSVVDSLRSGTHAVTRARLTRAVRKVVWVGDVLSGSKYIFLKVRKRKQD
jgi:hypothetical protein